MGGVKQAPKNVCMTGAGFFSCHLKRALSLCPLIVLDAWVCLWQPAHTSCTDTQLILVQLDKCTNF